MSNDGRLHLDLEKKIDSEGKPFYFCKVKAPVILDCSEGICFLVFCSEDGSEELQIAPISSPKDKR